MTDERGVLFGDGRCSVRLVRSGPSNELGYPTIIDVRAGPFSGSVLDETVVFGPFRDQLITLYEKLNAKAELGSYEGFELRLVGGLGGGILIKAKVIGEHMPPIMLTFEFSIDQSYLPEIIRQLDIEFPPPYRTVIVS